MTSTVTFRKTSSVCLFFVIKKNSSKIYKIYDKISQKAMFCINTLSDCDKRFPCFGTSLTQTRAHPLEVALRKATYSIPFEKLLGAIRFQPFSNFHPEIYKVIVKASLSEKWRWWNWKGKLVPEGVIVALDIKTRLNLICPVKTSASITFATSFWLLNVFHYKNNYADSWFLATKQ